MGPVAVETRRDFDLVRNAVNRWRVDNAPFLSRDQVVLLMLGQWLSGEGYLPTESGDGPAIDRAAPAIGRAVPPER